jgi:hypothetical protein
MKETPISQGIKTMKKRKIIQNIDIKGKKPQFAETKDFVQNIVEVLIKIGVCLSHLSFDPNNNLKSPIERTRRVWSTKSTNIKDKESAEYKDKENNKRKIIKMKNPYTTIARY